MNKESVLRDYEGSTSKYHWLKMDEQVSLRIFEFKPLVSSGNIPVVIVSGLATILDSVEVIIAGLAKTHRVYYIETREKTSSHISGKVNFGIEAMGKDVDKLIRKLKLEHQKYAMMGYSFGTAIIADCYRHLDCKPSCILFMEPTPEFHYPKWSLFLIRWFGVPLFPVLKSIAKWYLGKFIINKLEDNQMAVISFRALDHADPVKLKNAILAIAGYKIWGKLGDIDCPALVIGTSKDGLHVENEVIKMAGLLKKGRYIDLETNERTHNEEMVTVAVKFMKSVAEMK